MSNDDTGRAALTPRESRANAKCRFCGAPLHATFVDLGMSPLCESFLSADELNRMEAFYPLHVWVCDQCFLVQLEQYVSPEHIFTDYAYFSSYSDTWLEHARRYADDMVERFRLNGSSQVVELGSNDGYLLQNFVNAGIPALGVEPAANVAKVAVAKGVPTVVGFFSRETAGDLVASGRAADLALCNNVLAQVPDVNDFVAGMKRLLKPGGIITVEFPHLLRLMEQNQFDTIYHEHFSYLSLWTADRIFAAHGIVLFDLEELGTHGGSLRIYGRHEEDTTKPASERIGALRARELAAGVNRLETYANFGGQVMETKRALLEFLIRAKRAGKTLVGYGAPGKGNTLLNYCGVGRDFLDYTVDRNPHKHGKFLPGTHIPIAPPDEIRRTRPDYVLILPWNLTDEIVRQNAHIREWGGQFVVPIPHVRVIA